MMGGSAKQGRQQICAAMIEAWAASGGALEVLAGIDPGAAAEARSRLGEGAGNNGLAAIQVYTSGRCWPGPDDGLAPSLMTTGVRPGCVIDGGDDGLSAGLPTYTKTWGAGCQIVDDGIRSTQPTTGGSGCWGSDDSLSASLPTGIFRACGGDGLHLPCVCR